MSYEGKVALITGGGTGIGRASALDMARHGVRIAVNYSRSKKEAEEAAGEVEKLGSKAVALQADVSDHEQAERLVADAHKAFGRIDYLVNSAGMTKFIPFPDLDKL